MQFSTKKDFDVISVFENGIKSSIHNLSEEKVIATRQSKRIYAKNQLRSKPTSKVCASKAKLESKRCSNQQQQQQHSNPSSEVCAAKLEPERYNTRLRKMAHRQSTQTVCEQTTPKRRSPRLKRNPNQHDLFLK